jgi:PAS domain S-box-containing protein
MPSSPFPSHSPDAEHVRVFGRRVKALRKQAGLTRKELAAAAGMSAHHLNKVERGASGPSFGAIHALARGLGMEPAAFFSDTATPDLPLSNSDPIVSPSPARWSELVPRIALLGLDQHSGRIIISPSLSILLGLDGNRQDFSPDYFWERHVVPADRLALKSDLENLAAGVPVQAREARLLLASGARIMVVLQSAAWLLEQAVSENQGLAEGSPGSRTVWMTVEDVTHLDAMLRDHSASQVGQIFQVEELIRERERCSQALEQESHARRQAERMMLDAQRLLKAVMHSSQEALIILGPDLSVLDGNSLFRQLCLGECDPLKACHLRDGVDKKTLRRIKELISQAVGSKCLVQGEVCIEDRILELGLFPLLDAADKPQRFVLWLRDATRTSQQRDELRKQRRLLEKAEQMARMGSWEWDMETDLFRMSPNWFAIHGSRPRVLTAAELFPLAHPDDLPAIQDSLQKILNGESEYRIEHRIIRQDTGEVRWIFSWGEALCDETGRPVKLYGVCQDVTDPRENQRRLAGLGADAGRIRNAAPGQ